MVTWKIVGIAIALIFGILLLLDHTSAGTLTVADEGNADFTKIQDAIDNAEKGDTIRVFAGTYEENLKVTKSVNIIGNGSRNTTITSSDDVDVVSIETDHVNLSGFNVQLWWYELIAWNSCINLESDHCRIHDISLSTLAKHGYHGISLRDADLNIISNVSIDRANTAIRLERSNHNIIRNITYYWIPSQPHYGIILADDSEYNTITSSGLGDSGNNYIGIWVLSSNNSISDTYCSQNKKGIVLEGYSEGNILTNNSCIYNEDCGLQILNSNNNTIIDNSFLGNGNCGIEINASSGNRIENNSISQNLIGIQITDNASVNDIQFNKIMQNIKYGISVENSTYVTAAHNWWGHDYGPYHPIINPNGRGDNISQEVEFSPWQTWPDGEAGIWYVDISSDAGSNGSFEYPFKKIQEACDSAMNGDLIQVNSGCYYENVAVNVSVNLFGNSNTDTIIDGMGNESVLRINSDHVNISGFGITNGSSGIMVFSDNATILDNICYLNHNGIHLLNSSAIIIDNNNCSLNREGGIIIDRSRNIDLRNSTFHGNEQNGILIQTSSYCEIINNEISANLVGIHIPTFQENITIFCNYISNNSAWGMQVDGNDEEYPFRAIYNWWGDDGGPYHAGYNPDGTGDNITDNIEFHPWLRKYLPPEAEFSISPFFDDTVVLGDDNDGFVNGVIDVYYRDRIFFQEQTFNLFELELTFEWTFHCLLTEFTTTVSGDRVYGVVGADFLIKGMNGTEPIIPEYNSEPVDYHVTLTVSNAKGTSNKMAIVRVHPYAQADFSKGVKMGPAILDAKVSLVWRGKQDEVAPDEANITAETPVFVHIETAQNPSPNFMDQGGIGNVYQIRAEGCFIQQGYEGFIEATISLPVPVSELEDIFEPSEYADCLKMVCWEEIEKRYFTVSGSYVARSDGIHYVIGAVDHFSIFGIMIENCPPPSPQIDLAVLEIGFSRNPVLDGQELTISVHIQNIGMSDAKNVGVKVYDGDDLIGDHRIGHVRGRGSETVVINFTHKVRIYNNNSSYNSHSIKAFVNKERAIYEGPDNYENNKKQELLVVIPVVPENDDDSGDDGLSIFLVVLIILISTAAGGGGRWGYRRFMKQWES